ncbi:DNA topoisomerase [Clostridia bacterium]|nr:DNA topoisomerase [Clostridia bacterium]
MEKVLYIAEKPSVAREFAQVLGAKVKKYNGYLEAESSLFTWCVGHLVTMSYPEKYDASLKKWTLAQLPFLPKVFQYEVITQVKEQFLVVKSLLNREDVSVIYVCTDSGREGEYIYRLVEQLSGVKAKIRKRVWIDSQTEEEILRGVKEAKDLSDYDYLGAAAYLRAKEDYLMGINFSRLLTLKYGAKLSRLLKKQYTVLSVGRVMTCVLGMVVRREREIRNFQKTPFYSVLVSLTHEKGEWEAKWKVTEDSAFFASPDLYKDLGFQKEETAKALVEALKAVEPAQAELVHLEKKTEKKNPPLLYNLAELQNDCAKQLKISPDDTLKWLQELYEKKLLTYPRTDARVLTTAIAKQIRTNLQGLQQVAEYQPFVSEILTAGKEKNLEKSRYVNDKGVTDHYALIPTGKGLRALLSLNPLAYKIYDLVVRRFLSIFYPAAKYRKWQLEWILGREHLFYSQKELAEEGYLCLYAKESKEEGTSSQSFVGLKKGSLFIPKEFKIKAGETTPPRPYASGSLILAMENAGQFIEDESLREQIKGSGIGTSATRAEILKKLVHIQYVQLNTKTQVIKPTFFGELVYEVVNHALQHLLNPDLTASWEKGLTYVAEGTIGEVEYMQKLEQFILRRTKAVLSLRQEDGLQKQLERLKEIYEVSHT